MSIATQVDIDLFAGPGGWDEGIAPLGFHPVGFEWDAAACRTARAAGHYRHQADIAALEPRKIVAGFADHVRLLLGSPPCQGFSPAGAGRGRDDAHLLLARLAEVRTLRHLEDAIADLHEQMTDDRSLLVLEPLRWALALRPTFIALEQVAPVRAIWEACAVILRAAGYSVEVGLLSAEQYGVPQTRKRAILVARNDGATASLPAPTHSKYHSRTPAKLDDGVLPWVSMSQALAWGLADRPSPTITAGGTDTGGAEPIAHLSRYVSRDGFVQRSNYSAGKTGGGTAEERGRTIREAAAPSVTVTSKGFSWVPTGLPTETVFRASNQDHAARRPLTAPAPTIVGGERSNKVEWMDANSATDRRASGVRVTVEEASVLQSFPADYPWHGSKGDRYRQVGDAVPPLLAQHIVRAITA